jgi:hypothetical protein
MAGIGFVSGQGSGIGINFISDPLADRIKSANPHKLPSMRYNLGWRAPAHCGMANLVRSGTKQPQSFPVSAADQARLFLLLTLLSSLEYFKANYS